MIKDVYDGVKTRIRIVGEESCHFSVMMRLHQGSSLSSFLFGLTIDVLTCHIPGEGPWCMLL